MKNRFALVASLTALSLAAGGPSAGAAVTIGQLAPNGTPSQCTLSPTDRAQPDAVVPSLPPASALVISSWSFNAGPGAGQTMAMKVFRKIVDPSILQAVGHDGPRAITPGTVNTFSTNVPVQPGDFIGTNQPTSVGTACLFSAPGASHLFNHPSNLGDGQAADFSAFPDNRVNVSAVVSPASSFTLGTLTRNTKRGTATLRLSLPNPGELTASGNGVGASSAARAVISKSVGAGPAQLLIKAKGKKKRKLNETGKVKLKVKITYTPTGGDPSTQTKPVKLRKL
jgi:hypothetical protein